MFACRTTSTQPPGARCQTAVNLKCESLPVIGDAPAQTPVSEPATQTAVIPSRKQDGAIDIGAYEY